MIQRPCFILILVLVAHTYTIHTCINTVYIHLYYTYFILVYYTSLFYYTLIKNIYDSTSYFTLALFPSYCLHDSIAIHHVNLWETSIEDWKMLLRWYRTDICSCKLSAKVFLMLDNPFLVPSRCKLNYISVCFIQISTKSPYSLLESNVFLKSFPVFWAAR